MEIGRISRKTSRALFGVPTFYIFFIFDFSTFQFITTAVGVSKPNRVPKYTVDKSRQTLIGMLPARGGGKWDCHWFFNDSQSYEQRDVIFGKGSQSCFFLIFPCTGLGIVQLFSDRKNGKWESFTLSRGWIGFSFRVVLWINTPLFEIGSNVLGFTTVKATIKILTGTYNFLWSFDIGPDLSFRK